MSRWLVGAVVASRLLVLLVGTIALRLDALSIAWNAPAVEQRMRVVHSWPRVWAIGWLLSGLTQLLMLAFFAALGAMLPAPFDRMVLALATLAVGLELAGHAAQVVLTDIADVHLFAAIETLAWRLSAGAAHLAYAAAIALTLRALPKPRSQQVGAVAAAFATLTAVLGLAGGLEGAEMTYGAMGWVWCAFALVASRAVDGAK